MNDKVKINPLAAWSHADIRAYMAEHALPPRPMLARRLHLDWMCDVHDAGQPGEALRAGR